MRLAFLALLLLLSWTPAALAKSSASFDDSQWVGETVVKDGRFSHCFIVADVGGTVLSMLLFSDAALVLALSNPDWIVATGTRSSATFQVDQTLTRSLLSENIDGIFAFEVGRDPELVEAMRYGKRLYVLGLQDTLTVQLSITAAVGWLEDCFTRNSGLDLSGRPRIAGGSPTGTNPFDGGSQPQAPKAPLSPTSKPDGLEARLRWLLAEIGYPNPEVVDQRQGGNSFLFTWSGGGTKVMGFLAGGLATPGTYKQQVADEAAELSANCGVGGKAGDILYDLQTATPAGEPIYSGRIACGNDNAAIYFVVVADASTLLKFYHFAFGDDLALGQQLNANLRRRLQDP